MRLVFLACLCLALVAAPIAAERTLFVDFVEPSATTATLLETVTADVINADSATVGELVLDLPDGLNINTIGDVSLSGSFLDFQSSSNTIVNANADIVADSSSRTAIEGDNINFNVGDDFLLSSRAGEVVITSHSSVTTDSDEQFITSDGGVSIDAGAGSIDVFADDLVLVDGVNTELWGANRVSIFAQNGISATATEDVDVISDTIDLDSLGDFQVQSTAGNVRFVGGDRFEGQAEFLNANAQDGIDITARHGDVFVTAAAGAFISGENVNFVGEQDVIFSGSDVAVSAIEFSSRSLKSTTVDGEALSTSAGDDFSVTTGTVYFDIDENIDISLSGGSDDVFSANAHLEIRSYDVDITSDQFNVDANGGSDVFFATLQDADSTLQLNAANAQLSAGDVFLARSSSVQVVADDFDVAAADDITLRASTSVGDGVFFTADDVVINVGDDFVARGELSRWTASDVTLTASDNVEIAAGSEPEELLSIDTDIFSITGATSSISAGRNVDIRGDTFLLSGAGSFLATAGESIDLEINEGVTFDANGDLLISGYNTAITARELDIQAGVDATFTSVDETNINAGLMFFGALNQFTWMSDRSVQFDAFGDITVDDLDSITGGAVSFEGFNAVQFDADTITFISTIFSASSGQFGDIVWDGTLLETTGTETHTIEGNDVLLSGEVTNIIGSRDNIPGSVNYLTSLGSGDSITFTTQDITFSLEDGSNFVNADTIDLALGSVTGMSAVSYTALSSIDITSATHSETITGDISFVSGLDFSIESLSESATFSSMASSSISVVRGITLSNLGGELGISSTNAGVSITSDGFVTIDNRNAPADSGATFQIASTDLIITATTFRQTGAADTTIGGSASTTAKDRVSVNSIIGSEVTANDFEFLAPNTGDSVRFESRSLEVVSNLGDVSLTGGDILFQNGEAQTSEFSAVAGILLETNRGFGFTWNTADDFNSTAGSYSITAQTTSPGNMGVRFLSTHEQGDIVALARNGELQLVAPQSHSYSASEIQLYAAADAYFGNSFAPSAGGITFLAAGSEYDALYGDEVGAVFRTTGADGFIHILPNEGGANFDAADDIEFVTTSGALNVQADDTISFSTEGDILLQSRFGVVSLDADRGDVPITTPLDIDIETSAGINFAALDTVRLSAVSSGTVVADNSIGLEFVAHTGHVGVVAGSNNNVDWVAAGDFTTEAAGQVSLTATQDVEFTAAAGKFHFHGDTGLGYYVQNGDIQLSASDNVDVSSSDGSYIHVASGFNSNWVAQSGSVSITSLNSGDQLEPEVDQANDQSGIAMRTERNDLTFEALNGDINYLSSGRIQVQADGTANNIGGADNDGIFLVASQINSLSTHETVLDAEAFVRIGANTNPIVTIQAGGDTRASGVTITNDGGSSISTSESFFINSGGDFATGSVLTSDFAAAGDILITSTGTSPTGRDITLSTLGEFDIDANTLAINGRDSAFVSSAGVLSLLSTGNDPTSAFIDFTSVTGMTINVNGTTDIDVDSWSITSTDDFSVTHSGFVSFANENGASSGGISVQADDGLNFASDSAQRYISSEGNVALVTTASNADISIDAAHPTSDVLFHTGNAGFSATAVDEIDIDASDNISITSRDQDDDDTEDGNITLSGNDFNMDATRDLLVEGAMGLSIATTNPAGSDIDIESDGFAFINSWEAMNFQSTSGALDISVFEDISLSTHDFEEGNIILSSTRDVAIDVDDVTVTFIGSDSIISAGTVHWQVDDETVFETDGSDAVVGGTSEDGNVIVDAEDFIADVGSFELSATGMANVNAVDVTFTTDAIRNNIVLTSEAGLLSVDIAETIDMNVVTDSEVDSSRGLGYVDFSSQGTNPDEGYGFLVEATDVNIEPVGGVGFLAPEGLVSLSSATTMDIAGRGAERPVSQQLEGGSPFQPQLNDGTAVTISGLGPNGSVNVTSEVVFVGSSGSVNLRAETGVEVDGVNTVMNAGQMLFKTTHPYAHLILTATDFLVGEVDITSSGDMEFYGHSGVLFELQDDDDQSSNAEFEIDANLGRLSGRNEVSVVANGGGDILVDVDGFSILAGGDVLLNARQAIEFDVVGLSIDANGPVTFNGGSSFEVDASSFTAEVGGVFGTAAGSIDINANSDIVIVAGDFDLDETASPNQEFSVKARDDFFVDATDLTFIVSSNGGSGTVEANIGSVDFRDGLIIPFSSAVNQIATGANCGTPGETFYSPLLKQLCFCTDNSEYTCQFLFEYLF